MIVCINVETDLRSVSTYAQHRSPHLSQLQIKLLFFNFLIISNPLLI